MIFPKQAAIVRATGCPAPKSEETWTQRNSSTLYIYKRLLYIILYNILCNYEKGYNYTSTYPYRSVQHFVQFSKAHDLHQSVSLSETASHCPYSLVHWGRNIWPFTALKPKAERYPSISLSRSCACFTARNAAISKTVQIPQIKWTF